MKKNITIIGAGQAGLLLGIALRKANYPVTLITDKTAEQIYHGPILSTQTLFETALAIERQFDLNFFEASCPQNHQARLTLAFTDRRKRYCIYSRPNGYYQAVDQRLKFARWQHEFVKLGGTLQLKSVIPADLESIAAQSSLTIVATGKSALAECFSRHVERSPITNAKRAITCLYVNGVAGNNQIENGVRISIIPGVGEFNISPALTTTDLCHILILEGIPGGAFDCFSELIYPHEILQQALLLIKQYLPWEDTLGDHVKLSDDQAVLKGKITPIVRHPVAVLPSGRAVLGLGDTLMMNDPLGGQGANSATKAAALYYQRIIEHDTQIFDPEWMQETYNLFWDNIGQAAHQWSNFLIQDPLPPHFLEFISAATIYPALADMFTEGFNNPASVMSWLSSAEKTAAKIEESLI